MISRYQAILNGISLQSLSPDILITDISYPEPGIQLSTYTRAQRDGAGIYQRYKDKAAVAIRFAIRAYDIARRQQICQQVCNWAKDGGDLRINDRPGQRLVCICETMPRLNSVRNYTDEIEIQFAAYAVPYWQEIIPETISLSGSSASGNLFVPGDAPEAVVEVTITANATLTSISLTTGDTTLSLAGISVPSGSSIQIAYDDELIQSIKTGSTSLLANRTGADDLMAKCGTINHVSYTANASCTVTFRVRGWSE